MKKFKALLISVILAAALMPLLSYAATDDNESVEELNDLVVALDEKGKEIPLEKVDEETYNGFIVVLEDDITSSEMRKIRKNIAALPEDQTAEEVVKKELIAADSLETISDVVDAEKIEYLEPNYYMHATEITPTNDTYYSDNEWVYDMVGVKSAWESGITGTGQTGGKTPLIAVLDSGIQGTGNNPTHTQHEDLDYGKIISGANTAPGSYPAGFTDDDDGHGTFVAGEIAAAFNNGKGVAGLMPNVKLCPIKVLDGNGDGDLVSTIAGLYAAVNKGADVVNMSLGGPKPSQILDEAVQDVAATGCIIVASAGNDGNSTYSYPASFDNVVSVASVTSSGTRSSFSQYNDMVDAAAPGSDIKGLKLGGSSGYCQASGTSMAAPVVSAMAAMVKSVNSSVDASAFMKIIRYTSTDKGNPGRDNSYGYGIVNFAKALEAASEYCIRNKEIVVTPSQMEYTGDSLYPEVSIEGLRKGVDYYCEYRDSTFPGTATVLVTGTGKYFGTKGKTFSIVAANLENADVSLNPAAPEYTGLAIEPAITIKGLRQGTDFTVDYSNNTNAGTASYSITAKSNYCTGSKTGTFEIARADITKRTITVEPTIAWTGSEVEPEVSVAGLEQGTDYEVSYSHNIDVGTGYVTVTGINNFRNSKQLSFTIGRTGISQNLISISPTEFVYDGTQHKPAVTVEGLTEGQDYKVSYSDNINVGIGYAIIRGIGNYAGTTKKAFRIKPRGFDEDEFSMEETEFPWTGEQICPAITAKSLTEGKDYQVTYSDNVEAGTATATIKGINNYTGTVQLHFTIEFGDFENGTLHISENVGFSKAEQRPWHHYASEITSVEIDSTVTVLGDWAFYGLSNLEEINLPNSLTEIGDSAFAQCDNLATINLPDSLTTIGANAFSQCGSLSAIDLPDGLTGLGDYAFYQCDHLSAIDLPDGIGSIGAYVFYQCDALETVTMPAEAEEIGAYAFYQCANLEPFTFPEGIKHIREYAFYQCGKIESVRLTGEGYVTIDDGAFQQCTSLFGVRVMNATEVSFGASAFEGCTELSGVSMDFAEEVHIHACSFKGCANLWEVRASSSGVKYWIQDEEGFAGCTALRDISLQNAAMIGPSAFKNCTSLRSLELHRYPVQGIGEEAFRGCENLQTVTIDASVNDTSDNFKIGSFAFSESGVKSFTVTNGKVRLEASAFENCSQLEDVTLISGFYVGERAFYGCSNLSTLNLTGTGKIGQLAFAGHNLSAVTIPAGVSEIGAAAFNSGQHLESITVASGNQKYDSRNNCNAIIDSSNNKLICVCGNTVIPDDVTVISDLAYAESTGIETVTIPEQITSVEGVNVFEGCSSLATVIYSCKLHKWAMRTSAINKYSGIEWTEQHDWKNTYTVDSEATCTTVGEATIHCRNCSETKDLVESPALGHDLQKVPKSNKTCFTDGNRIEHWYCSRCEKRFTDEAATEELTGNSWIIPKSHVMTRHASTEATCDNPGNSVYYSCSACGNYYSDNAGNNQINENDWVVTVPHTLKRIYQMPATCFSRGNIEHWKCTVCNQCFTDSEGQHQIQEEDCYSPIQHGVIVHYPAKEPTCTRKGNIEYWYCNTCSYSFADEALTQRCDPDLPSLGHKLTLIEAKEATCAEPGNIAYKVCTRSGCGKYFNEKGNTEIAEGSWITTKPHSLEEIEAVPVSCTENGYNAYYHCTSCEGLFKDSEGQEATTLEAEVIEPIGHDLKRHAQQDPTCEENGNIEYWSCSRECCDGIYYLDENAETATTDIAVIIGNYIAIGHSWDEGEVTLEPTCDNAGERVHQCTNEGCDQIYIESIGKIGHEFSEEWSADKNGHWHACTHDKCAEADAAGPHTWNGGSILKPVTCTAAGEVEYICTICGYVSRETIPATGHRFQQKVVNAQIGIPGKTWQQCSVCGTQTGETVLPALNPAGTKISSLKAAPKGFTVKWKKKAYSGYQIRYSLKSSMKSSKTVTIKKAKIASKKITKLKSKKKYFVQVRTFKTVNGKKWYSAWSKKRSIKTK